LPCQYRHRHCGALLPHHFTIASRTHFVNSRPKCVLYLLFVRTVSTFLFAGSNSQSECGIGCVFSVALSLGLPPVAVNHHRTLSCPDFPPPLLRFCRAKRRGRPPDPLFSISQLTIITKIGLIFQFLPCDFDMFFEVLIVGFREIASEVDASTLLPHLGRLRHKKASGEHVLAFPAFGRIKDFVHHVPLPESDDLLGLCEWLGPSCDADISPHKGSK